MEYQSQCKQDKFLNEIVFENKVNGVFVDIGANDGITYSNSFFFEKYLNWTGLCVEPLAQAFEKLTTTRKCFSVNGCATTYSGTDTFLAVDGYGEMLSGLKSKYHPKHYERLLRDVQTHGGAINEVVVQCYNINHLLADYQLFEIDFVSLDTEGGELEMLKALDFNTFYIRAFTIENNFKEKALSKFLLTKNFEKVADLDADEVFVNKREYNFFERFRMKFSR